MENGRPNWAETKHEFAWDGSWLDIYISGTVAADWDLLLAALRPAYEMTYSIDGQPAKLPESFASFQAMRNRGSQHLVVILGPRFTIDCYFFVVEQVEFSLDPREVQGEREFELLLSFLILLGATVQKPVLLTPENGMQHPILMFDPKMRRWTRT